MNRHGSFSSVDVTDANAQTEVSRSQQAIADEDADDLLARSRRLKLRRLRYGDIPELSRLYACTQTPHLLTDSPMRFIDVAAQVARIKRGYAESPGLGTWRADTHDGNFIGIFSLAPVEGTDDVQVGARLMPQVWGRWFAIEGGHVLCHQAFDVLRLPQLIGFCHRDHRTARSVLARFGFRDIGATDASTALVHRHELDADAWRSARRMYT